MNYFCESGGNDRSSSSSAGGSSSSSSSSSSRKGKKSGSDKPKQPQRGLGVAQLEKIRLHSQMGFLPQEDIRIQTAYTSSSLFSYTPPSTASFNTLQGHNNMMGKGELERTNLVHGESQFNSNNDRWDGSYAQPAGISRGFFSPEIVEDLSRKKKRKDESDSMGSGSQNSDSNGSQELDLELRLAL